MSENDEASALEGWGLVPKPVVEAVHALNKKILRSGRHLDGIVWPDKPRDVQDLLRMSVSDAHKVARASTDLRALLTAYAHRFHQPRPVMADLARAQDASPQGIPRRYGQAAVEGLAALLSEQPDVDAILAGFTSLALSDLAEFDGPIGEAARSMRDSGTRPRSVEQVRADHRREQGKRTLEGIAATLTPIRQESNSNSPSQN
ncbi:hypothetical protein [Rathayibacter agropyri]|uniref:hypothetical protein n=1 Tax=Rathayibacter agropyri TaxID=1634927 RepID=UPI0015641E1D|nr:hypothetical protein [Rathayibacter agropyri]NRD08854.1 hypothetical protein [Rathayibacter agropyri]